MRIRWIIFSFKIRSSPVQTTSRPIDKKAALGIEHRL